MNKQKIGLVLFWISVIWMMAWLIVAEGIFGPLLHRLTTDEINQTIWSFSGSLNLLSGISIFVGAILTRIWTLRYAGTEGLTVWKVEVGIFIVLSIAIASTVLNYYSPPVFGLGGGIIILSFIGILWLLAKERMALEGSSRTAIDFRLVGYEFMLMAAWILCGKAAEGFVLGLEGLPKTSMMNILILLVFGWPALFLSHNKSRQYPI